VSNNPKSVVSVLMRKNRLEHEKGMNPLPQSQPVAGTFGEQQGAHQTDQDLALHVDEKTRGREQAAEPDGAVRG